MLKIKKSSVEIEKDECIHTSPLEFNGKTYETGFDSPYVKIKGESGNFKIISWEISSVNEKIIIHCWWEGYYHRSFYAERIKVRKTRKKTRLKVVFCDDHPQYGAIRRPRTDCVPCWKAYESTHLGYDLPKPTKLKNFKLRKVSK